MSYIDVVHLFIGICIGLIFGLWGGIVICKGYGLFR